LPPSKFNAAGIGGSDFGTPLVLDLPGRRLGVWYPCARRPPPARFQAGSTACSQLFKGPSEFASSDSRAPESDSGTPSEPFTAASPRLGVWYPSILRGPTDSDIRYPGVSQLGRQGSGVWYPPPSRNHAPQPLADSEALQEHDFLIARHPRRPLPRHVSDFGIPLAAGRPGRPAWIDPSTGSARRTAADSDFGTPSIMRPLKADRPENGA